MRYRSFAALCFAVSVGRVEAGEPFDLFLGAISPPAVSELGATFDPTIAASASESILLDSTAEDSGPTAEAFDPTAEACCFRKELCESSLGSQCGVQTPFWYLNSELTTLSPINTASSQNYVLNDFVAPATVTPFASTVDANQLTAAPRLTFGKSHCNGWGIQTSYWGMNTIAGSDFAGPITGPAAVPDLNRINVQESFRAYTFDIEATKRLQVGQTQYWGTFGARHASLTNATNSVALGESVNSDTYVLSALSQTRFNGTGLTYSLMGIRPISTKCISLYGGGRLSNVFGNNTALAQTSAFLSSPAGGSNSTNGAIDRGNDALFIGELQTGLLYSRCLKQYGGRMFARGGFEYQYWNTADRNAFSTSFAGVSSSSNASVSTTGGDLKTHLVGFSIGAGYAW